MNFNSWKQYVIFISHILIISFPVNSQEHSFGLNTGFTHHTFNGSGDKYSLFSYGFQYSYYTKNNFYLGIKYLQGARDHNYLLVLDPFVGYRLKVKEKVFPEIGIGSGIVILGSEIPDMCYNIGGKAGLNMAISEWMKIGLNYQLLYKFSWYYGIIDQISLECNISLKKKNK